MVYLCIMLIIVTLCNMYIGIQVYILHTTSGIWLGLYTCFIYYNVIISSACLCIYIY